MCFAPSFLRSRGGAVTRITKSSYCRGLALGVTLAHALLTPGLAYHTEFACTSHGSHLCNDAAQQHAVGPEDVTGVTEDLDLVQVGRQIIGSLRQHRANELWHDLVGLRGIDMRGAHARANAFICLGCNGKDGSKEVRVGAPYPSSMSARCLLTQRWCHRRPQQTLCPCR